MIRWRQEAFEKLPEFRTLLQKEKSAYGFLGMLVGELDQAHLQNDKELIERIYNYAKWCANAPRGKDSSDDLPTIATVSFYEDLPKYSEIRKAMGYWFSRKEIEFMKDTLMYHGTEEHFQEIVSSCEVAKFKKQKK
jgi:hypothetical protein